MDAVSPKAVIAEGVGTIEHIGMLKEMNCDMMQGLFFSRPLPQEQANELLKRTGQPLNHGRVFRRVS